MPDTYAGEYAESLEPIRYAANDINSEVGGLLRAWKAEPHNDQVRLLLSDALRDAGSPIADIVQHGRPERLYPDHLRQRAAGHELSYSLPMGTEQGFLVGYNMGGIYHDFNGINLHLVPIDPDAKFKNPPALSRQGLHRFVPYYFSAHLGRRATKQFVEALTNKKTAKTFEESLKGRRSLNHPSSSLWPDEQAESYVHSGLSAGEWKSLVHRHWPKDEYYHAFGDELASQGDPLAELIQRDNARGARGQEGGMHVAFPHRGFEVGLRRFGEWEGSPMIRVKADLQHPSGEEYPLDDQGQLHHQVAWINFSRHFTPEEAKRWAEGFATVGRPPELVTHLHDMIDKMAAMPKNEEAGY